MYGRTIPRLLRRPQNFSKAASGNTFMFPPSRHTTPKNLKGLAWRRMLRSSLGKGRAANTTAVKRKVKEGCTRFSARKLRLSGQDRLKGTVTPRRTCLPG